QSWAEELDRQADALETYAERVVERLTGAGYRWYETANFCRSDGPDRRAQHNLAVWRGHDYLGLGVGAVSTLGGERRRNRPSVARYVQALLGGGEPPREHEPLDARTRALERVMLALRLDEPVGPELTDGLLDQDALEMLVGRGLVERDGRAIRIAARGRLLADGVTAALLA
ncbi:MAG: radical SAM family heme chaperone HemW, partial [Gaiella sp.]